MIALTCQHTHRAKHGKRNGQQRWRCRYCHATFTRNEERPLGDMRTDMDKAVLVLSMLLEGMSIRACERLTGMKDETIVSRSTQVNGRYEMSKEGDKLPPKKIYEDTTRKTVKPGEYINKPKPITTTEKEPPRKKPPNE